MTLATRIYEPEPAAASFRLAALASALADSGAEVTVTTTTVPGRRGARPDPRVRVRRWPVLRDRSGYVRGYLQYLSFDVPLALRLLLGRRPDVVVAEPPPTTGFVVRLVCGLRRVRYVYYAADVWSDAASSSAPGLVVRLLRGVEGWVWRGAAAVIAVTDGVADRVRDLGARDVVVIRNGIDTGVFTPDGPREDLGPTAVYAGTMSEWQGADVFVRALPEVRERVDGARLVFLGQGSAREAIERLASELGVADAVEFRGVVPPDEAARWLRSARLGLVSVRPDLGYDFAFPTKVLATLATGTPVLYAGPGDAVEVIDDAGLGAVVEYDPRTVTDALVTLLQVVPDDAYRARLGAWVGENGSSRRTASDGAGVVLGVVEAP